MKLSKRIGDLERQSRQLRGKYGGWLLVETADEETYYVEDSRLDKRTLTAADISAMEADGWQFVIVLYPSDADVQLPGPQVQPPGGSNGT